MLKGFGALLAAATLAVFSATDVAAHGGGGGGGGGGHGGGHGGRGGGGGGYIFIPVPVPMLVPQAQIAAYDAIKTVAVVSAIGQDITFHNTHFLDSRTAHHDIRDWKIDELVSDTLKHYLSPRYAFKDIAVDRAAIAALPSGSFDETNAHVRKTLAAIDSKGIDAFIVVRPDLEAETPGMPGMVLETYGALSDQAPVLWANYEIDIINAHTLQLFAKAYSRIRLNAAGPADFAFLTMPASASMDDKFAPTPAQLDMLQRSAGKLVTASLIETLRALQLGQALPGDLVTRKVPLPPARDPYKAYKSAVVISALGDRFALVHGGSANEMPVPGWQLDTQIENHVRTALAGRFAFKDAALDRSAFTKARLFDADGNIDPEFPGLKPSGDVDLYIVVLRANISAWDGAQAEGVGIENGGPAGGGRTAVFANYVVAVLDAHTMSLIIFSEGMGVAGNRDHKPYLLIDNGLWPQPALAADQLAKIRGQALSLTEDSLDETLGHLALTGETTASTTTDNPAADALLQP